MGEGALAGPLAAPFGARRVCLVQLREAERRARELAAGDDAEALHDFRVAIRRLRTLLRAYEAQLSDTVRRRHRKRLGRLAARTNPARDLEVQLKRLAGAPPEVRDAWRARVVEEKARAVEEVLSEFAGRAPKLERALSSAMLRLDSGGRPLVPPTFAAVSAGLLETAAGRFAATVSAVAGEEDVATLHRARIEGKRLRYLLEPWRDEVPETRPVLARCKELQDELGALHDVSVWLDVLLVDAPPLSPELRATLRATAMDERRERFARFQSTRAGGAFDALRDAVGSVAARLREA